ncbi:hypothetical protein MRS44_000355 [Fusarium solani]|uniref:uncharacterized protein n=1 Tax=Fusarium solani TaxID=169388 RepID=UPI0032C4A0D1|nr:hypothetical protein MRS44_000355 [Fusarium solani]
MIAPSKLKHAAQRGNFFGRDTVRLSTTLRPGQGPGAEEPNGVEGGVERANEGAKGRVSTDDEDDLRRDEGVLQGKGSISGSRQTEDEAAAAAIRFCPKVPAESTVLMPVGSCLLPVLRLLAASVCGAK